MHIHIMYMHMHLYMYMYMYVYVYTYAHARICVYVHACMYSFINVASAQHMHITDHKGLKSHTEEEGIRIIQSYALTKSKQNN